MEQPPKYVALDDENPHLQKIDYPVSARLERMRSLARLLDTRFTIFGGFRIGIDPIIGLIPGIGDFIASSLSIFLLYDAARLGIPKRILALMILNVIVEAAVGTIPVLGNVVDAVYKANVRNMRLVEKYYTPTTKERPIWTLVAFILATFLLVYGTLFFLLYLLLSWFIALAQQFLL